VEIVQVPLEDVLPKASKQTTENQGKGSKTKEAKERGNSSGI